MKTLNKALFLTKQDSEGCHEARERDLVGDEPHSVKPVQRLTEYYPAPLTEKEGTGC